MAEAGRARTVAVALVALALVLGGLAVSSIDAGASTVVLVPAGSVWRYRDDGTNQGTAWRAEGFADSTWRSGAAQLGYGDGGEATVVSFGPSSTAKYITTYFRRTFSVADASAVTAVELQLVRDDGALVYLNGTEVARSNMPTGTVGSTTRAVVNVEGAAESSWNVSSLAPSLLHSGTNTIAVEVHQQWAGSSDLSFDLSLTVTIGGSTTTVAPTTTLAPTTTTTRPTTTTTVAPGTSTVLAAGDIAKCPANNHAKVATLLHSLPGQFLALGDNAYPNGRLTDFQSCYDPYFGSEKARTRPVPGNHEYDTGSAAGYLTYFGSRATPNGTTWYSFDVGTFHFVALDSDCSYIGGCASTSAQYRWLQADLAASTTPCLVAYFHHTPWSSFVGYGKPTAMVPIMQLLQREGADAILAGHMHSYERFARMNANGQLDPTGFRTFVVATGGDGQFALGPPVTGSEARQTGTFGLLRLDLRAASYDWRFVPVAGSTYTDTGTDTC